MKRKSFLARMLASVVIVPRMLGAERSSSPVEPPPPMLTAPMQSVLSKLCDWYARMYENKTGRCVRVSPDSWVTPELICASFTGNGRHMQFAVRRIRSIEFTPAEHAEFVVRQIKYQSIKTLEAMYR